MHNNTDSVTSFVKSPLIYMHAKMKIRQKEWTPRQMKNLKSSIILECATRCHISSPGEVVDVDKL
jgi:hypothetical protein